ncbi:MAG: thiol-disulfide oxidoreductase DCC family protein [Bryobacteraceae bacterium]
MADSVKPERAILFYDGHCGLCHGAVSFTAHRDRAGMFAFAPLDGETFERLGLGREALPDSLVLRTEGGRLLVRSEAVLHILRRLGGVWEWIGRAGGIVPRGLADALYDLVARVRGRLFARPAGLCPVTPARLRDRFLP